MLTPEQAAERPRHVGASELGALFGQDDRMTRYELWHIKAGLVPPKDLDGNDRVFWGTVLEPAIAQGIAQMNGWEIRPVPEYRRHPVVKGWGSSLDFEILNLDPDPVPLELKNVDRLVYLNLAEDPGGWIDGQPPVRIQLQVQGQIACTPGSRRGVLGVLIGGNDPKIFHYDRHDRSIARIASEIPEFWRSIEENRPPLPDWQADLSTIMAIYNFAKPDSVQRFFDSRLEELAQLYKDAAETEVEAVARKKACKAEILTIIGEVETALTEDWKILAAVRDEVTVPESVRKSYRDFRIYPAKSRTLKRSRK